MSLTLPASLPGLPSRARRDETPAGRRDGCAGAPADLPGAQEPLFTPPVPAAVFEGAWARLRRAGPAALLNRAKRPFSRWRHAREDAAAAARFPRPALDRAPATEDVWLVGAFGGANGLGRAARYELDRLKERHRGATIVDVGRHGGGEALGAALAGRGGRPPALAIFLMQPNLVARHLAGVDPAALRNTYRIALAVWELPYFPPGWRAIEPFFNEFWTPSTFSAAALALGTARPVRVVPHPVRFGAALPPPRPWDGVFRGLSVMDLSTCPARKNPWAHVEAWQKAFGDDPDCELTLKLRFSRRTAAIRGELRRMVGGATNIRLVEREMTDAEVLALQAGSDVCLSLHRSEGFGLTIREMLELGKAAVATGWSGNTDFMDHHAAAYPVRYRMVPYRDDLARYPGFEGRWAEADTDHAARCLRAVALRHRRAHAAAVPPALR